MVFEQTAYTLPNKITHTHTDTHTHMRSKNADDNSRKNDRYITTDCSTTQGATRGSAPCVQMS